LGLAQGITTAGDPNDEKFIVSPKDYPYFVSLGERGSCAGAIVGSNHVLTAAHCFCKVKPEKIGKAIFADGSKKAPVAIYYNPACKFSCEEDGPNRCDVAMVEFEEDIAEGFATVKPYTWEDEVGKTITILGYGLTGDAEGAECIENRGDKMRRARNVVTKAEGSPGGVIKYKMDGDSGGPAIIQRDGEDYIAGVNSGTNEENPCDYDSMDQYTRISAHASFIQKVLDPDTDVKPDLDLTSGGGGGGESADYDYQDQESADQDKPEDEPQDDEGDEGEEEAERKFELGGGPLEALLSARGGPRLLPAILAICSTALLGAAVVLGSIRYMARSAPSVADQLLQVEEQAAE